MQFTNWHEMRANKWVPNNGANEWKMSEKRWIIRKMTDKRCGARMRLLRSAELNWIIKQPANDSADACFLVMNSRKIKFIHHNFHQRARASSLSQHPQLIGCHLLVRNCQRGRTKWNSRSPATGEERSPSPQFWLALWHSPVHEINWIVEHNVHVERFP